MTWHRRDNAARIVSAALALVVLAACGSDGTLEADGPPTTRRRFPVAVVSTTTPSTNVTAAEPAGGRVTTTTRKPALTATSVATTTTVTSPPQRIRPAETPLPIARTGVGGVAWQGLVVVAGGIGAGGGPSVRVDAFDPGTGQWSRAPNLPVALHDASLAVLGDNLWIVGGFAREGDQDVAQSATYFFRPAGAEWESGPSLQEARAGAGAATLGNFLVVLGGQTGDGTILSSVEVLANGGAAWKVTQPLSEPRAFASALAMNGRIYAVGGRNDVSAPVDTVESWRSGSPSWRKESRLDSKRAAAGGAAECVAGGQNPDGVVASVECFGAGFWIVRGQMGVPRYGLAAVVLDGWLHLIAGASADTNVTNIHEVVDLAG